MIFFRKKQKVEAPPKKEVRPQEITTKKEKKHNVPRILVYGIEKVGLNPVERTKTSANFILEFEPFETNKKFQDYDGVILFQSIFEIIVSKSSYRGDYLEVDYDRDELVRRVAQLSQLVDKGGFVCFLIHRTFVDKTQYQQDLTDTDLCKIQLNYKDFYRESLGGDFRINKIYRSEFNQFLKDYGIAKVEFSYRSGYEQCVKKICGFRNHLTGLILLNNRYFIPCFLPKASEVEDFFTKIVSALVATSKKLFQEIPAWIDEYKFEEEKRILKEEAKLQKKVEEFIQKRDVYRKYKRCLCYDGDLLVESVVNVLREGLGFVFDDKKDEHIEDKAILDESNNEIALIEVKGTNDNVKNINISQADMHRSRRDKPPSFPSVLIVNTFIKPANSISEKLRDIGVDQITLASSRGILVMRTIDLLNLLYLEEQGQLKKSDIIDIFLKRSGWLKVSNKGYEVKDT